MNTLIIGRNVYQVLELEATANRFRISIPNEKSHDPIPDLKPLEVDRDILFTTYTYPTLMYNGKGYGLKLL